VLCSRACACAYRKHTRYTGDHPEEARDHRVSYWVLKQRTATRVAFGARHGHLASDERGVHALQGGIRRRACCAAEELLTSVMCHGCERRTEGEYKRDER
jgi:hypothetical protein